MIQPRLPAVSASGKNWKNNNAALFFLKFIYSIIFFLIFILISDYKPLWIQQ